MYIKPYTEMPFSISSKVEQVSVIEDEIFLACNWKIPLVIDVMNSEKNKSSNLMLQSVVVLLLENDEEEIKQHGDFS